MFKLRNLSKIKENPKYFFSWSKRKLKYKTSVGPLVDSTGNLQHDEKTMADILQTQFCTFSFGTLAFAQYISSLYLCRRCAINYIMGRFHASLFFCTIFSEKSFFLRALFSPLLHRRGVRDC